MKLKKDDYFFKVNGKTADREIHVPKLEEYPYEHVLNVHLAALEFAKLTGEMLKTCLAEDDKPEKSS